MTRAICLRCDWDAELGADPGDGARDERVDHPGAAPDLDGGCPRCGAALYVDSPQPPAPHQAAPRGDRGPVAISDHRESWSGSEPSESRRRVAPLGLAVPIVILASIVAVWSLAGGGGGRPLTAARPGRLVYDGIGAGGDRRLWELDLSSRDVRPGLEFDDVSDLQWLRGDGWSGLGFTRSPDDARSQAYVAGGASAYGHPQPLISGRIISWDPSGASVAAARSGTGERGCGPASIVVADLNFDDREHVYEDPRLCGGFLSLARSGVRTTVSLARRGRIGTFSVGYDVLHRELSGHVLLSASPMGDLLVTPAAGGLTGLAPIRSRRPHPATVARPTGGTVVYWRGRGGPTPVGGGGFIADRVLAWSGDGSRALVVGDLASAPGVYLTDAVPGGEERLDLVSPMTGAVTGGTFAADGTAYFVMDGRVLTTRGGTAAPLQMPGDAPVPAGPIVWMP